ncbi:MAG TPA: S4 domain-containing protein [Rhodanobacteraceae bacterium]|nr:S4 domain-containing protein [Rhodanobacteraceae bacterium]
MQEPSNPGQRADLWLWMARFYRSRSLARQAIDGGKVGVNGAGCKPSRLLQVGDRVQLLREHERWDVEILALATRRGPAAEAQALYREDPLSRAARDAASDQRRLIGHAAPQRRPDKAARRQLRDLRHKS